MLPGRSAGSQNVSQPYQSKCFLLGNGFEAHHCHNHQRHSHQRRSTGRVLRSRRQGQLAVPNPLGCDQRLCNLLDLTRTTTQDQNLKAVVMVKVNVNRAHDLMVMPVLHLGQTIVDLPDMVVINQRQRADHLLLRCSNEFFNQRISHQVPIRFRAACVALGSYRSIESIEKRCRNRDAQTAQCFLRGLF